MRRAAAVAAVLAAVAAFLAPPGRSAPVLAATGCLPPPWPPPPAPVARLEPGDVRALAEVIYGESRGDGWCSMIATGHVVLNRMRVNPKVWGGTIAQVVNKPYQFSSFGTADPNLKRMKRADESEHAFYLANLAALAVLQGAPDQTNGATHFYHVDMKPPPTWALKGMVRTARIGSHVFLK